MRERYTIEARRAIVEKVLAKLRERGFSPYDDQEFQAITDKWISGEVTMPECWQRFLELLKRSQDERQDAIGNR